MSTACRVLQPRDNFTSRDLPALFARDVPLARQMLRKLIDGHIAGEPIMEGGQAGYRFTATGTFDRLLTGMKVTNCGGGGQGIQPSLTNALRFDIQAVALAA